jgi:hypothetical protein
MPFPVIEPDILPTHPAQSGRQSLDRNADGAALKLVSTSGLPPAA